MTDAGAQPQGWGWFEAAARSEAEEDAERAAELCRCFA
jgi:hypothetical protein